MPPLTPAASQNMESVAYCGDRSAVVMEWNRRRYKFLHSKPVLVPDAFGEILLARIDFCREGEMRQPVNRAFAPNAGAPILFRRWGALGDLLMFRTAAAAFHRAHPEYRFGLRCQARFASIFEPDPLWARVTGFPTQGQHREVQDREFYTGGVRSFDQVAEADHRGDQQHRVHLFLHAMTDQLNIADNTLAVLPEDWQIPVPEKTSAWVERHLHARELTRERRGGVGGAEGRRLVAIQLRGSAAMKALPEKVMHSIIAAAAARWAVILIEPGEQQVRKLAAAIPNVYSMPGRDALHGIAMLRHVDLAIVMDSGPLWMTHCAPCPTLAILGPTRPAQRIALHPLYPAAARAICLNDTVVIDGHTGCPACFEAAQACKKSYACMSNQPDWTKTVSQIIDEASRIMAGDPPRPTPTDPVHLPVLAAAAPGV